jgi:bifunctional non-homologous end joining protein LigD
VPASRRGGKPARAPGGAPKRGTGAASSPLEGYRAKRDFDHTPEPAPGAEAAPADARRFVVHEHHARSLHWDLRLERDGVLVSWAIPKGLPEAPRDNRFAAATEDHPLQYLDFEAEIPKGQYGAGTMTIWDRGTYECLKWEPRKVEVALHGERIDARYALFPIDEAQPPKEWMIHRMDPPADPGEPMPRHLVPMLARAGAPPPDDGRWAYEIKWDGVRAIAYSEPGELRLESRNLNDITDRYPELARLNRALSSHRAVLDGEIVAFDDSGRPSFEALQRRMHVASKAQAKRLAGATPVTYVIFDLLWLDGHALMDLPYLERRERLEALGLSGASWQTPAHVVGQGQALLSASAEQGLEGIVAKRIDSTYQPGLRSSSWVKIKTVRRQEFVIGGWLAGKGRRTERIGALLLGVYERDGALRYVGRVGSGLSDGELERLSRLLMPLRQATSPFSTGTAPPKAAVFCEPRLVAEVAFSEWTAGGNLRHPTYKGLRDDKPAELVVREQDGDAPAQQSERAGEPVLLVREQGARTAAASVGGRELALSNLDKVMYPSRGFTKRELIDYYAAVAPVLLGHLEGRALTVTRWPDGVAGKSFFAKQAPAHRPDWVRTATLASERGPIDYILAEDLPTLVWLANLAAIELHTPLSRVRPEGRGHPDGHRNPEGHSQTVERPTTVVFDLDPGAPAGLLECCRVALRLQALFENLGLSTHVKTSGSKGLQVYLPLNNPDATYAQTKPFAKAVAELLAGAEPDLVVSRMTRARRTGKVLIDWSQNDAKKTTVCVYSLRATERPTASTPLAWEEVREAHDSGDAASLVFEAEQVLARVAEHGDLFAPVLSLVQALPAF